MISLLDCIFTMVLILLPEGATSRFENMKLKGSCMSTELSFLIVHPHTLRIETEWELYYIPLPQHEDRTRLTYRMTSDYAYLGDCQYGLSGHQWSPCQRVMVRFGPKEPT